ncbi:MAG: AAA domain-containing protein [Candidatus Aminicenantes bacterium]|nr:AAA domain-containing protein [Gammaproteobacteria bacterium]NIO84313.1 AAA domain-containing protein [Candidatus Aminicenantes bacterium]NIQ70279.1 AAA domain-containing protein [Candidatus Aminicenantes bacterium]NIT26310.1 AAA domain-containing protein [Candidatus Aminicenantes bacterium]
MIEIIKKNIWNLLKKKEVSLAMIYDIKGNILWHKGREITGRTVADGKGFSKTYIERAFTDGDIFENQGLLISLKNRNISESVMHLHIKSLIIHRIHNDLYMYIDSGTKETFSEADCEIFKVMGEILGDTLNLIRKSEEDIGGIAGISRAIENIRKQIVKYAMVDDPVLLTGETGTGKTHIAALIHRYSGRKGKFKVIDTPGIPDNLFESEMFGHAKGAFTDARVDKNGLVEEAAGGTLFIDEITEISPASQAKLLRFIETGKYTRLGEAVEREVDVRIVAATNKNLQKAIKNKEFRQDLYYRLNVFQIELPPLRERKEDIKPLVMEMKKCLKGKKIGQGFWEALFNYQWPGNIRELISVLKRASLHHKDYITGEDIKAFIDGRSQKAAIRNCENETQRIRMAIKNGTNFWEAVKKPFLARDIKRSEVKEIISWGLKEANGKYKKLIKVFNLEKNDYHRFMRFLHEQALLPEEKLKG